MTTERAVELREDELEQPQGGILIGLLLPAVQKAGEAPARLQPLQDPSLATKEPRA